ncbi:MAG: dihydroorotase [Clostridia bacterium]|nr:dihydroorotase [Clostridia bacterium]
MDLVIKNVHAVNPGGVALNVDIAVADGRIVRLGTFGDVHGIDLIDGTDLYAFPGFCDAHCRLREIGFTHKEDIVTGAYSAASGGYTDICMMPNTRPVIDTPAIVTDVLTRAREACIDVWPIAAITKGMKGRRLTDFARLHQAGAIAFSDDGMPLESIDVMTNAMRRSLTEDVLLMVQEDLPTLFATGVYEPPERLIRGAEALAPESEEQLLSRDLYLAERYGGRLHLCHVGSAGSIEQIRRYEAKHLGNVSCETAPSCFATSDAFVATRNVNTRIRRSAQQVLNREAVVEALIGGVIGSIATDRAPRADADADQMSFELYGFETAFPLAITNLFAPALLTLPQIARLMSTNPRHLLGLPGGYLAAGQPADIALCDLNRRFQFGSRSTRSPFAGMDMHGSVVMTIKSGRIVYDRSPYQS